MPGEQQAMHSASCSIVCQIDFLGTYWDDSVRKLTVDGRPH